MDSRVFEKQFKELYKSVGLEGINVHATRHMFTTLKLKEFPSEIPTIKDLLGHAQLSPTYWYVHEDDSAKRN